MLCKQNYNKKIVLLATVNLTGGKKLNLPSQQQYAVSSAVRIMFLLFIAFSRNERTHPNFVRRREKSRFFCEDCKLALPLGFPGALVTRFTRSSPRGEERVTSLRRSAWEAMFVLAWFSTVWHFLWTGFSLWLRSSKKRMQSNVDWSEVFGRAKTNYFIAKHVYTTRFVRDRSFLEVLILERAWPVW